MTSILYIIDSLLVAGAQVHLVRLANDMAEMGMQPRIICLGAVSESLVAQLRPEISVDRIRMESIRRGSFFPSFLQLVRLVKVYRPQIVHTYLNTANVFGVLAAKLGGTCRIITSRRDMGNFRSGRIGSLDSLISRRWADRTICVCNAVARRAIELERVPSAKVRVIYNGVDLDVIHPRPRPDAGGPTRFGIVARMDRIEKGHAEFIAATRLTAQRRPGLARFVLVGDGYMKDALHAQIEKSGQEHVTTFAGEVSDSNDALSYFDVSVVPSYTEGICNAAIEAMAAGFPVIATAVDGNLEVVQNGETGFLVPARNQVALADMFIRYLDEPSLIGTHGRSGRKRCEEVFNRAVIRKQYHQAYCEVLDEPGLA